MARLGGVCRRRAGMCEDVCERPRRPAGRVRLERDSLFGVSFASRVGKRSHIFWRAARRSCESFHVPRLSRPDNILWRTCTLKREVSCGAANSDNKSFDFVMQMAPRSAPSSALFGSPERKSRLGSNKDATRGSHTERRLTFGGHKSPPNSICCPLDLWRRLRLDVIAGREVSPAKFVGCSPAKIGA